MSIIIADDYNIKGKYDLKVIKRYSLKIKMHVNRFVEYYFNLKKQRFRNGFCKFRQ